MPPGDSKSANISDKNSATKAAVVSTPATDENDVAEKKRLAMLAMEGEGGKRRREALEKRQAEEEIKKKLQAERTGLEKKIEELSAEKEKLELKWIELNEVKSPLEKNLTPVVTDEIKVEKEEEDAEKKEKSSANPKERQSAEKMRWGIDDKRRAIEKERWRLEDEIGKIDDIIKANSEKYQRILAEMENNQQRLEEIIKNLAVYGG